MKSRRAWYVLVLTTGLSVAAAGVAQPQTVQTTPKPMVSPKAKTQSQVDGSKLRVEGMVTQVAADWFEIEVLRSAAKASTGPAIGSRIRIHRTGGAKVWRDGAYLRDGIVKVGEKVQIAGTISSGASAPMYTAKLIKVVQTTP
jgi:hypothetical protein